MEAVYRNEDRPYNVRCLVKRLQRINKEISGEGREMLETFVMNGDLGAFAKTLPQIIGQDFKGTMTLLRDGTSRAFLTTTHGRSGALSLPMTPRIKVASDYLFRTTDGRP